MPGLHWSELPADVLAILRRGAVIPAHPLALDERRQFDRVSQRALARYYIDAGSGGLAVGVHATQFQIRDVGPLPARAGAGGRDGAELGPAAAGDDRRRDRQDRPGPGRGAHGARPGLSRRAAWPQRDEGRERGRADRALQRRRGGDAADRLLPADGGRRHPAVAQLLDALRGHRQRRRHQGRALQSLRHARCRVRRRGGRRRGARHALYRQRRSHRGGPGDTAQGARRMAARRHCASRVGCSATGACGRGRP